MGSCWINHYQYQWTFQMNSKNNTYLKALAPACHSLPISTLNLMCPTLQICGAQPDMVHRHPRARFHILDQEATWWEPDPGMRMWDKFGFEGEFFGGDGVGSCESHSGTVCEMTYAKGRITISGGWVWYVTVIGGEMCKYGACGFLL